MKILLIIIFILVYKALNNFVHMVAVRNHQNKYFDWLAGKQNEVSLAADIPSIKKLMSQAGIEDLYVPITQPIGYMQIATANINVFHLYPTNSQNYAATIIRAFEQAFAIYKSRIIETVNPLYWINLVIYLPKNIIEYIGFTGESAFTKLLQLIWWIVSPIAIIFRDNIYNVVSVFLSNLK